MRLYPELAEPVASDSAAAVQATIDVALNGHDVTTPAFGDLHAPDYLNALRSLAGLQEHFSTFEADPGTVVRRAVAAPPRDTSVRMSRLIKSHALLHGSPDGVVEYVREELERLNPGVSTRLTWLRDHTLRIPLLDQLLEEAAQSTASVGNRRLVRRDRADLQVAHIPQLIWDDVWGAIGHMTESGEVVGRAFASLTMAKYLTRATWQEAGLALALPTDLVTKLARSGRQALRVAAAEYFAILGDMVMARLDGSPDYRAREASVRDMLVDDVQVAEMRQVLAVSPAFDAVLRHRLWHDWVQGHPATTPVNADLSVAERGRLAVQQRRWPSERTELLARLMSDGPEAVMPAEAPGPTRRHAVATDGSDGRQRLDSRSGGGLETRSSEHAGPGGVRLPACTASRATGDAAPDPTLRDARRMT